MTLPYSGAISLTQIANELSVATNTSFGAMCSLAFGSYSNVSFSAFYGYTRGYISSSQSGTTYGWDGTNCQSSTIYIYSSSLWQASLSYGGYYFQIYPTSGANGDYIQLYVNQQNYNYYELTENIYVSLQSDSGVYINLYAIQFSYGQYC